MAARRRKQPVEGSLIKASDDQRHGFFALHARHLFERPTRALVEGSCRRAHLFGRADHLNRTPEAYVGWDWGLLVHVVSSQSRRPCGRRPASDSVRPQWLTVR